VTKPLHILISRTDSIGDVVLTLPVAGLLKTHFPQCRITLIGQHYTLPLAEHCQHIDGFLDWKRIENESLTKQSQILRELKADIIIHVFPKKKIAFAAALAGIPRRIGTTGRLWHWISCTKLVRMSRRKSNLHESQLNLMLLKPLGIDHKLSINEIPTYYGLQLPDFIPDNSFEFSSLKKHIILHPGSRGSAREWGIDNFMRLAGLLPPETHQVFITGTAAEGESLAESGLFRLPNVQNLCGKFDLSQLIGFVKACDALVACSTGPLHLAAALGTRAIGIYPPIRPMHPGRWAPLGNDVYVHVADNECNKCRGEFVCECIRNIRPEDVASSIQSPGL